MNSRKAAFPIFSLIVALSCPTIAEELPTKTANNSALQELASGKRRPDSIFSVREVHKDAERLAVQAAAGNFSVEKGYEFLQSKDVFKSGKDPVWLAVSKQPALDASDVESAVATFENGEHGIAVTFSKEGRELFTEFTKRCVDRRIALVVEGKIVISAPVVRAPISAGRIYLPYGLNEESSKALAAKLNSRK